MWRVLLVFKKKKDIFSSQLGTRCVFHNGVPILTRHTVIADVVPRRAAQRAGRRRGLAAPARAPAPASTSASAPASAPASALASARAPRPEDAGMERGALRRPG